MPLPAVFPSEPVPANVRHRILIADDEMDFLTLLETRLSGPGFEVLKASDGPTALRRARDDNPALVVLDVTMPGMSGLEVCRALKGNPETAHVPIMIVSARHEEIDRILGFEFGADDYVVKPFSPRELVLRIKALLRQRHPPNAAISTVIKLKSIAFDRSAHRVTVQNRVVHLTRTELKLLGVLMETPGRVFSREELLEAAWPAPANVELRTVDTHMRRLREKLGSPGRQIQTVRGFGYRIDGA